MSAEDTLRRNKTDILKILYPNRMLILNKVQQKNLITDLEYDNLKDISGKNNWEHVVELVDKIMNKDEETCQGFLDLLQTDEEIKSTFPKLRKILQHGAGPLPKPVQASSSCSEVSLGQDNKGPKTDGVYPLNSQPVGLCLIINNVNFTSHKVRNGSDQDAQSLAVEFDKLGFRVLMCKNQKKDQMDQTLTWFSSLTGPTLPQFGIEEWSDNKFTDPQHPLNHGDAFICCLLSHGVKDAVLGTDGSPVTITHIKRTFRATEQSALKGKPKVFLIQACQGNETQCGVSVDGLEADSSISEMADILVAISTVEDHESYRHPINGSWFIQSVCQQLRECCPRGEDLLTILTHVNDDVSQKEGTVESRPVRQMSDMRNNTLRKKLVFSLHHN